jgi:hypothetical protein
MKLIYLKTLVLEKCIIYLQKIFENKYIFFYRFKKLVENMKPMS